MCIRDRSFRGEKLTIVFYIPHLYEYSPLFSPAEHILKVLSLLHKTPCSVTLNTLPQYLQNITLTFLFKIYTNDSFL